ncbi:MAG: DNA topoisomerase [Lachnospiraceae bacterium]
MRSFLQKTAKLQGTEQKVYDLIARSVLCMLYPDAVVSKTTIRTACNVINLFTNGTSIVEPGFYTVLGLPKETFLPSLTEGEKVDGTFSVDEKWTEPPKRYTDATLLATMINCGKTLEDEELRNLMAGKAGSNLKGLGRPSSQASIVKTLETRGYTEKQGKSD